MALNLDPNRVDTGVLRTNQQAIERHLNDDHYVCKFTPGMFVLDGAAVPTHIIAVVGSAGPVWPAVAMPDADTSRAAASWLRPSEWRSGLLRVTYWYTSPVGSTNNFRIRTSVGAVKTTEVLNGTALLVVDESVAGPAVANTVASHSVYTTTSLGGDDELFGVRVARLGADAADTNVNDFDLLFVKVQHIPAQQVSQ